jgi:hypothetical protein
MRIALVDDQPTPAGPDGSAELAEVAPPVAVCPDCGHPVTLRQRLGTWHSLALAGSARGRHVHGTPLDCPARFNAHSNEKTADGGLTTAGTGEVVNAVRPFDKLRAVQARDAALVEKLEEVREMLKGVDAERIWILCGVRGVDGGLFLVTYPDGDGDFNAKAQRRKGAEK